MKFSIKPASSDFELMLEAVAYQNQWAEHGPAIIKAFYAVTGLKFQQTTISARVYNGRVSNAGRAYHPMLLAGDHRSADHKVLTIIHELAHRLLGGNALDPISLGLIDSSKAGDETDLEFEHRHIYLFAYDVARLSLGEAWGDIYEQYESKGSPTEDNAHNRARTWAMSMNRTQRQDAVRLLAARAVTRPNWKDLPADDDIPAQDPAAWFATLKPPADKPAS